MRKATAVVLTIVLLAPGIAACGWEPDTVGPQRDPKWTTQMSTGSGVAVRATIADDVVLVEAEHAMVALAAGDGHLLWHVDLPKAAVSPELVWKVRLAGQTVVIASLGYTRLYDLATGQLKATLLGGGLASVSRSLVYIPEGGVQAFDTATGQKVWQARVANAAGRVRVDSSADPAESHLLVAGDPERVVVTSGEPGAQRSSVLDARSGKEIGTLPGLKLYEGQVFVTDHTVVRWDTQSINCHHDVTAYETVGGAQKWATTAVRWEASRNDVRPPGCQLQWKPLLAGDRLLIVTAQDEPQMLDVDSGTAVWTGTPESVPVAANEDTVLTRQEHGRGKFAAVDLASGSPLWSRDTSRDSTSGVGALSGEIIPVKDGFVLTVVHYDTSFKGRNHDFVYVYNARDGQVRWRTGKDNRALMASAQAVVTGYGAAVRYFDP